MIDKQFIHYISDELSKIKEEVEKIKVKHMPNIPFGIQKPEFVSFNKNINMITEQYVDLDTAKLLKEAGFDVPAYNFYEYIGEYVEGRSDRAVNCNKENHLTSRPTQSLAARWIREKYHIFLMLTPMIDGWMYDLFDLDKHQYILCNADANTDDYESAFEAGLQESLQLIIKNKQL